MHRFFLKTAGYILPVFLMGYSSCSTSDELKPVDCSLSDLTVEGVGNNPTSCSTNDGSITVIAAGGIEPYQFAINAGSFGASPIFNNLGGGNYTVSIKDKNGCENSVDVLLEIPGTDPLTATTVNVADTECIGNNGSIEVLASGGTPPYQYKLGAGVFIDATTFNGLGAGTYSVAVKDATDCVFIKGASVSNGDSQTSLANDIKPIIDTECAIPSCHNGNKSPDLRVSANIISNASRIKSLTQSGAMPQNGSLTSIQKALIACWVDDGAKNN